MVWLIVFELIYTAACVGTIASLNAAQLFTVFGVSCHTGKGPGSLATFARDSVTRACADVARARVVVAAAGDFAEEIDVRDPLRRSDRHVTRARLVALAQDVVTRPSCLVAGAGAKVVEVRVVVWVVQEATFVRLVNWRVGFGCRCGGSSSGSCCGRGSRRWVSITGDFDVGTAVEFLLCPVPHSRAEFISTPAVS